ncbi:hypothetical protein RvVAR0630_29050 [Agrobacterium vitis]|uniref:hypothetical protein n=1 Tax=Agrobacterium vitis TaxID=373 RepID=UPI0015D930DB|nr:hypothetical protein [Agrobacterium vitis]BCH60281.1 hypothetical protein RvVAR0630_29050 [Agrobacterium vitis]
MAIASRLGRMGRNFVGLLIAALILLIGYRIAIPGLNSERFAMMTSQSAMASSRFSILALGTGPVVTAFAYVEILRLFLFSFVGCRNWVRKSRAFALLPAVCAIIISGFQAYGVASALQSYAEVTDSVFVPVAIACLVGGTAAVIALINRTEREDIGGLWLLLAVSALPDLIQSTFQSLELAYVGALAFSDCFILLGIAVLAITLATFAVLALSKSMPANSRELLSRWHLLLWPPILASIAANYLWMVLFSLTPQLMQATLTETYLGSSGLIAISVTSMMALVTLVYARILNRDARDRNEPTLSPAVVITIILIQAILFVGLQILLPLVYPQVGLTASNLLIVVTVLMVLSGLAKPNRLQRHLPSG